MVWNEYITITQILLKFTQILLKFTQIHSQNEKGNAAPPKLSDLELHIILPCYFFCIWHLTWMIIPVILKIHLRFTQKLLKFTQIYSKLGTAD